jgi:short subunit dehydrogenase-like uncharacterized protein
MNTEIIKDWTVDDETGRSNSSLEYVYLQRVVCQLIKDSAFMLINGNVDRVARLIVARLAHVYGLEPTKTLQEMREADNFWIAMEDD